MARSPRDKFLIEYMRSNFTQEDLNIRMRKIGLASQQITIINLLVYNWYPIPKICQTMGEHWNYDTTEKVLYSKGYDFDDADWYYALNMIYSDYYKYKSGRSDDTYIELAHDFLSDSDAPKNKAKRYFLAMCY